MKKLIYCFMLFIGGLFVYRISEKEVEKELDSFNNVKVFFNGVPTKSLERNLSKEGYNLGLKYQCVEFVKRYYYEYYGHQMPDSYGHAKDFYNPILKDGEYNTKRGLIQFSNPSLVKPEVGDIIVFKPFIFNPYGHVAIISDIQEDSIEIIQQNVWKKTREKIKLNYEKGQWNMDSKRIVGRLSKKKI